MFNTNQHQELSDTSSVNSDSNSYNREHSKHLSLNEQNFDNNTELKFANESLRLTKGKVSTKLISRIPERNNINIIRRKSKGEKEDELHIAKEGAMNQIENTIKITEMIKEKSSKLFELQAENENLRRELRSLQFQLEESKNVNAELIEKLHITSDTLIRRKIESENQRANDLADDTINPKSGYDRYLQDIISNRDQLKEQNSRWKIELEKSNNEVKILKQNINYLETISDCKKEKFPLVDQSFVDSRSKSELLQLVRKNIDEKIIWMEYAIKLTQKAVQTAPHILQIEKNNNTKENDEYCCKNEANWAAFAINLLQQVNKLYPTILHKMLNSQNFISSTLIDSKLS